MRLLLSVLDDLFTFAHTALFGVLFEKEEQEYITGAGVSSVVRTKTTSQLPLPGQEDLEEFETRQSSIVPLTLHPGEQYFIGIPDTLVYVDPVVSFDSVMHTLPYGEMVAAPKFGGRWALIHIGDVRGWILKDTLREQATDVFPVLVEDVTYEANDEQTIKLRLCINDTFHGGVVEEILTDVEYVVYALFKKNTVISWPTERPRIAGRWQRILRGQNGIHIGITPKTDTVMEYVIDDVGHVCYVEAVFSDETIKIRGIGILSEGTFSVLTMSKEEWRELRPVFIEIS